ncbi:DNA-binding protein [Euzebyella marina]|uniref:DNA-binding protein n=1 Tax=Euzebyella marina TaxID=1761453 RepID=A0A3G2L9Z9_9FLAO|nr:helix-turn-helix domain-containing protein [Euzebyella marina]AYN69070.1 DNA-binding protein [Euzebyella marina]
MEKNILNLKEACHYTGFSKSHLYKLTHYRKIIHYKPNGKNIFFKKSDLEAYMLRGKREAKPVLDMEEKAANYILDKGFEE